MELDNIKKHCDRLIKQIDLHIGKGKGKEILSDLCEITGNERRKNVLNGQTMLVRGWKIILTLRI